jgi:hypothetical protein
MVTIHVTRGAEVAASLRRKKVNGDRASARASVRKRCFQLRVVDPFRGRALEPAGVRQRLVKRT